MANEQLPSSSSPTLASEPSSTVQTENESNDGSSDGDDDKHSEQSPTKSVKSIDEDDDEKEQQSDDSNTDYDKDNESESESDTENKNESEMKEMSVDGESIKSIKSVKSVKSHQTDQIIAPDEDNASNELDEIRYEDLKIIHDGRDILDLGANIANKSWNFQYAHLPEKNYQMYMNNRSQYNRLSLGFQQSEPNYTYNECVDCKFDYPVLSDLITKSNPLPPSSVGINLSVGDLVSRTLASIMDRHTPIKSINAITHKMSARSMASPIHTPTAQSINLTNFMLNTNGNGASTSAQSYAYQNRQFPNINNTTNTTTTTNANPNCFKPNTNQANAFYGNNMMLNALVNQIGNNMNNSSAFNSNFMQSINGTNPPNQAANQLNNTALANLLNSNRQQQSYGMCRHNMNKSGINFNANSHKTMPTYSHF